MLLPVYESPVRVDSTNIEVFRSRINQLIERYGSVVVDCSEVALIDAAGMHVLRVAAMSGATVRLVHPSPALQLMAAAYGFEVDRGPNATCIPPAL